MKTTRKRGTNFRLAIISLCQASRDGMFNAWEIQDLLRRVGVTVQNNGQPITEGFLHGWFNRIGYRRGVGKDWWYLA